MRPQARRPAWQDEDAKEEIAEEAARPPLTVEEARRLREANPSVSPWRVVAVMALVMVGAALAAWAFTGRTSAGWSAAYGGLAVVLPATVFARGLTGRLASVDPMSAAMGFMVWEMVKLGLTFALLIAAPRLVPGLSWPALLAGLVLTMKVYWLALAWVPRGRVKTTKN